jgi:membrane-associated protein
VLLGIVLPGETAAIVSGVLASQHQLSLDLVVPLVVVAAVAGDSTGYALGRFLGRRLLATRLFHRRRAQVDRAADTLRTRGGLIIVASRFLPFLRTFTPAAAGVSRKPYLAFFGASLAGGLLWGIACPLVGYIAADSYHKVEEVVGPTGIILLLLLLLGAWAVRTVRRRRNPPPAETEEETAGDVPEPEPPANGHYRPRSGAVARPRRRVGRTRS